MKFVYLLIVLFQVTSLFALSGEEILEKMDKNGTFKTISYSGKMIIKIGNQTRTKSMTAKAVSGEIKKAVVEYTNPEDAGTRYLMLEDNLWIYFPEEDDVVKISGHMLKEGMMGSDVSYEDALESDKLTDKYSVIVGQDVIYEEKSCYFLILNAKVKDVPYFKREMIVSKDHFICLNEKMYAKSGKELKESKVLEIKKIDNRTFPVKSEIVNKLRKNSSTVFIMNGITFDEPMDDNMFSMRYISQ